MEALPDDDMLTRNRPAPGLCQDFPGVFGYLTQE